MAVSKRSGPDILYLANAHSQKMKDLDSNKEVNITFHDSKTQDWISISGTATTISNTDQRIKELHNAGIKAWFGDLGDGKHDGGPDDPRMTLIEVKSKFVVYYKTSVGTLGMMKEVGGAMITGKVANTGVLRELKEADLEKARTMS
jgi:general stress protein 26